MPKILLLTVSDTLRGSVVSSLGSREVDCDVARTVSEARKFLRKNAYAIVVLDSRILVKDSSRSEEFLDRLGNDSLLLTVIGSRTSARLRELLEEKSAFVLKAREAGKALSRKMKVALEAAATRNPVRKKKRISKSSSRRNGEPATRRSPKNVSEEIELRFTRCTVPELVKNSLKKFRPLFRNKRVSILFNNPDQCPPVRGDRDGITRVLDHLIGNALRFSEAGGRVEISILLPNGKPASPNRQSHPSFPRRRKGLIVTIRDSGVGISKEEQKNIFLLSSQTPGEADRDLLNLPSTRFLVESHGGEIWLESGKGKGTAFHFYLPASN